MLKLFANGVLVLIVIISKPRLRLIGAVFALICVLISYGFWFWNSHRIAGKLSKLTLLIDPGHGGVDGGTKDYQGNLEKNINLAIALKVRNQLQESGLRIVMTRDKDTDLAPFHIGRGGRHRRDLLSRVEKARDHNCLFLVSIHCDAERGGKRRGAFTFYNYLSAESKALALAIQEELNRTQGRKYRSAPGKYLIIRQTGVTGVLVEVGFLSHPEEAKDLQNKAYQEKLALAIAAGILKYCRSFI